MNKTAIITKMILILYCASFINVVLAQCSITQSEESQVLIYDNSITSGYIYYPGVDCEILDWGNSIGGTVKKFSFRYATKISKPGLITVRFYEDMNRNIYSKKLLAEYKIDELKGSPDGNEYSFEYSFFIPDGKEFELPNGSFGYSFVFNDEQTGIEMSRGGSGNENFVWVNSSGPHRCNDIQIWAGFYMKLYALEKLKAKIKIEPQFLNIIYDNIIVPEILYSEKESYKKPNVSEVIVRDFVTFSKGGYSDECSKIDQGIEKILQYRQTYNGQGISIAICDTGIDYTNPQMGGKQFPNQKIIGGYDFGEEDKDPAPGVFMHGTLCACVAAGDITEKNTQNGGIAYGAKLYALKIKGGLHKKTTLSSLTAALNWCIAHKNDDPNNPIMVINISYGGKRSFTTCDGLNPALTKAVNVATEAGITILSSSGNDSWTDSIRCPACISNVISVGAVDTTNRVLTFSNRSQFLDVLAPSNWSYNSKINEANRSGETSSACAYAAGAVACLQSAAKDLLGEFLEPSEVKKHLISTGDLVTDDTTGIVKPLVNLNKAIESLVCKGKTFSIFNDGAGNLRVSKITTEKGNDLSFWPEAPFDVKPGDYQEICVKINNFPLFTNTRILIFCNDSSYDPFTDGVYVMLTENSYSN